MPELLRPAQVARALNVSNGTVRRWIVDGHLRSIKTPGGQYRIDAQWVDDLMAKLTASGTSEPVGDKEPAAA